MDEKFSIAKEGIPYIGLGGLLAIFFFFMKIYWFAAIILAFTLFCLYFFRDPPRTPERNDDSFVSPADGKIIVIDKKTKHELFPAGCLKVSIFMSVFNVHINRSPTEGKITRIQYRSGKFLPAYSMASASDNEQNELWIENNQTTYAVNQIAGILARRIVCWKQEGDNLSRTQRFGLIQFGSRVDIFLPTNFELEIKMGDSVYGGQTILGHL